MFAQPNDRRDFFVPDNMLLKIKDYVREEEFRNPSNLDIHGTKTLLAVKNGRTTGTTYGRVNGFESITRHYPEYGIEAKAIELIVLGYDTKTGENDEFSKEGDSGSVVTDKMGRIIGQLTGGGGPTNRTDKTYIIPYYVLKKAIEEKYPKAYVLPAAA